MQSERGHAIAFVVSGVIFLVMLFVVVSVILARMAELTAAMHG